MQKTVIVVSIMLVIIAYGITLAFSKIILNPLEKLTKAARRIKDGDYKTRAGVVTADDFGILADSFNDMADSLAEKEFMRDTFGKVVDPEVRDYLMSGSGRESLGQALGGQTREVTVLFCDIRNFTAMSEKMQAADVVSLFVGIPFVFIKSRRGQKYQWIQLHGMLLLAKVLLKHDFARAVNAVFGID